MSKETLSITKEAAVKAYDEGKKSERKLLENLFGGKTFIKNIRDKIQGWQDILDYHKITQKQHDDYIKNLKPRHAAIIETEMITEAYNQGGEPNFDDGSWKGALVYDHSNGGFRFDYVLYWDSTSDVGARQLFVGPEYEANAKDATAKFHEKFKQARMF